MRWKRVVGKAMKFFLSLVLVPRSRSGSDWGRLEPWAKPGGNRNPDPSLKAFSVLPDLGRVGLSGRVRGLCLSRSLECESGCRTPLLVGQGGILVLFLRNIWREEEGGKLKTLRWIVQSLESGVLENQSFCSKSDESWKSSIVDDNEAA
ncbi:uncharacterized protein BKA55DRAFT_109591 [Fusarium redolens]|uniref:Uncharacterized protein n=1 Tax=Fusarium redolens TaxID=48865 RepID=A0A9P9GK91_FUSRE|nr:uncharacterized protein BKA55DRAFT_109591 [Fusarium redolens]KAH7241015.1 hypothetical protein BKA55DRAFT_109591 [Fusarium redolens]